MIHPFIILLIIYQLKGFHGKIDFLSSITVQSWTWHSCTTISKNRISIVEHSLNTSVMLKDFTLPFYFCRCRKLPRALKEWPAFEDLRRTIDDFNEMVPLLELMANKAMKPRHWNRMQDTTDHVFDVENENFTLRSILQAPLLRYKEEIEVSEGQYIQEHIPSTYFDNIDFSKMWN